MEKVQRNAICLDDLTSVGERIFRERNVERKIHSSKTTLRIFFVYTPPFIKFGIHFWCSFCCPSNNNYSPEKSRTITSKDQ
jgi:hypothetical protein